MLKHFIVQYSSTYFLNSLFIKRLLLFEVSFFMGGGIPKKKKKRLSDDFYCCWQIVLGRIGVFPPTIISIIKLFRVIGSHIYDKYVIFKNFCGVVLINLQLQWRIPRNTTVHCTERTPSSSFIVLKSKKLWWEFYYIDVSFLCNLRIVNSFLIRIV